MSSKVPAPSAVKSEVTYVSQFGYNPAIQYIEPITSEPTTYGDNVVISNKHLPDSRLLALLLTSIFVLSGCSDPAPQQQNQRPAPQVGVYEVEEQPLALSSALPGRTRAWRTAEVRPQVNGIIEERLFVEGSVVDEGSVLYQIDDAPYRAALARANASLTNARNLAKRYENLVGTRSISQQQYDDALAALRSAEAEYEAASINMNYTRVKAPITGKISRSRVSEGALVTSGQQQEMATITQLDPIYVDIVQPVTRLLDLQSAIEAGLIEADENDVVEVSLVLENGQDYPHTGLLKFSEVVVDEGTGSVTLRAEFPNPDGKLLPGMFVRALVEEGTRPNAILVPQQAVSRDTRGVPTVWVLAEDNTVSVRQIETERTVGNAWLVQKGLQAGEQVVTEGVQRLAPGIPVQPAPAANVDLKTEFATQAE
ncbi:MAG TPA: efflux RND transporter periplasmic adaptor subunit [Marinobacter hydrocarbonoclasticus]|uniref:Efflux RND transporter periplasmic adaptor subunit n=2 Tax=Marinobacter TaxID=2742 RepID=A0A558BEY7_9GAMM|nr:hemolysin D [Marinobacter sp. EN3]MAH32629.1 efflux RND transporter periplasmic adaptor subunit [Marinobacter sp.]MBU73855.1 efflux RND transporter periplasmic adaptor subunit [Spongiibacter sp.]TVT35070.1 MAG: efflux RND transporter periplasmic adaptor subunit [Marinobacter vinifirmus]HAX11354.1 efflux RND transporter periplasmic adaptor subunit [Marinobacter nauticus]